jgi:hypothetical protein
LRASDPAAQGWSSLATWDTAFGLTLSIRPTRNVVVGEGECAEAEMTEEQVAALRDGLTVWLAALPPAQTGGSGDSGARNVTSDATAPRSYTIRITRSLNTTASAELTAAGVAAPTLDDGYPNEETVTVEATTDPQAYHRAMRTTTLRFRGHIATVEQIMPDGSIRLVGDGYAEACDAAATAQGLDPAEAALREHIEALPDVGVEQTGGFCMVLTVTDPRDPTRIFTITSEETDDAGEPLYLVINQPQTTWAGDEEHDDAHVRCCASAATTAELVAIVVYGEGATTATSGSTDETGVPSEVAADHYPDRPRKAGPLPGDRSRGQRMDGYNG